MLGKEHLKLMDHQHIPKTRLPGAIWITTVQGISGYYAVMYVKADNGSDVEMDKGQSSYGTRFEAALEAKEWSKRAKVEYEMAGTNV
jgi:hypothetical protein